MSRRILLVAAVSLFFASPLFAIQPNSTIAFRSPTFTSSYSYRPTSTINARSPTFRSTYYYDYYGSSYRGRVHLGFSSPYRTFSTSSGYYRSVLSSGRGLDASRGLYGSSGVRTYSSR